MGPIQKVLLLMVGTGVLTSLVLSGHQTATVLNAFTNFFTRSEHTVITGNA